MAQPKKTEPAESRVASIVDTSQSGVPAVTNMSTFLCVAGDHAYQTPSSVSSRRKHCTAA